MISIHRFNKFFENLLTINDILESMGIGEESLLSIIDATRMDITDILPGYESALGNSLDNIQQNGDFIDELSKSNLIMSDISDTADFETFLINRLRFATLRNKDSNELVNPEYLLIQSFNDATNTWSKIVLYKINDSFNKFYDKLSSRTIELTDGNQKYIYKTSIRNEWELSNRSSNTDFPKFIRNKELGDLIKTKNLELKYI